jgi:hypothetical protein
MRMGRVNRRDISSTSTRLLVRVAVAYLGGFAYTVRETIYSANYAT